MAHFFQLSDPEIAQFEFEILITCFFPEMAHFFSSQILRWLNLSSSRKPYDRKAHSRFSGKFYFLTAVEIHLAEKAMIDLVRTHIMFTNIRPLEESIGFLYVFNDDSLES